MYCADQIYNIWHLQRTLTVKTGAKNWSSVSIVCNKDGFRFYDKGW